MENKITVIDKKGNKKEYELKDELLPGERIFKKDGVWYITDVASNDHGF